MTTDPLSGQLFAILAVEGLLSTGFTCLVLILTLKFAIETYTIKILFVFLFLKCSNSDFFITFQKHSKEFEVQLESNNLRKRIRKGRKETCPRKKMILKKKKKEQLEVKWYEEQRGGVWHYIFIFHVKVCSKIELSCFWFCFCYVF